MYQGKAFSLSMLDKAVAELTFDYQGESVNKFSVLSIRELGEALDALAKARGVKGLLITSGKDVFVVGADIMEFGGLFAEGEDTVRKYLRECNACFSRLEELPFPVVVAINGYALGGGMEFCLACDYRVASNDAKLGLPEVKLGIIPGWGGTVRLPRTAGLDTALEWIAAGKEFSAEAARTAGVVDAAVAPDKLRDAALHTLRQCMDGKFDYAARRQQKLSPLRLNDTESLMAFETAKMFVAGQAGRHYPAPVTAVKAMQKAAKLGRDEALAVETEGFVKMAMTPVATALAGIFVNDQLLGKKTKNWRKQSDRDVQRAAVLGAGIMGGGIACQSARMGIPIQMKDIAREGLDAGLAEANKILGKRVERGRMSAAELGEAMARIVPVLSYDSFDQVDLVVEAVVENARVKRQVLAETEQQVRDDTILTSNTSTISITHLAEGLKRPENFCGMHFFNPVHVMPLVEVIRGEKTSERAIARTVSYAAALGKKPVVVRDCPGFLVNRVLFPYFAGFAMLVRDGADFRQIDKVMENWGWPMGPAHLLDVVGLDTAVHAEKVMADAYPERMKRDFESCTDILYKADRYGQKNKGGFYDYQSDKKGKPEKVPSEKTAELLRDHGRSSGTTAREFDDEEIIARMMIPMATELTRCLEEGIVETAAEADLALVYGTGFPPFRGGVFRWLDSLGGDAVAKMAEPWQKLGPLYQLPERLQKLATDQQRFYTQGEGK